MHLILDGHVENVELMTDKALMKAWLAETVEKAGMTCFGEAFIYGFPWPGSVDWTALTGFQPLMESHCSIHCWPERKYVFSDLFSCKDFNDKKLVRHIKRSFKMDKSAVPLVLDRGIDSRTGEIIPTKVRGAFRL